MDSYQEKTKLIERYLRGKASLSEEIILLHWIKSNPDTSKEFIKIKDQTERRLLQHQDPSVEKKWKKLQSVLSPGSMQPNRKRQTAAEIILRFSQYAAVLAIGIFLTLFFQNKKEKSIPVEQIVQQQTISTPKGARSQFILPDGSKVWLNAGTSLSFSVDRSKCRSVQLDGEAYFEVVKNDRPFIVDTRFGSIQVKGTSFDVKAFENDDFLTTVETGLVAVTTASLSEEILLKPGEQSYIGKSDQLKKHIVNTNVFTSWRNGILIFQKDPLQEIVKKLERWYNVSITVTPQTQLKNYRFTGTIEMESLTEVLELIRVTAPIKYNYDVRKRTVIIDTKE